MDLPGFTARLCVELQVVERWIAAGWILPAEEAGAPRFTAADLARAELIRDMAEELGVNAEGIGVALALLDQLHGLRLALRQVAASVQALPEPLRSQALAALARD